MGVVGLGSSWPKFVEADEEDCDMSNGPFPTAAFGLVVCPSIELGLFLCAFPFNVDDAFS